MPLSDTAIRNAKNKEKPYKLHDEKGLYILVNQAGKYFRFDYRFGGKRKTLALGVYPDLTLKDAREKHAEARKQIVNGVDPAEFKKITKTIKAERAANSFEAVAREWFTKQATVWAESHSSKIIIRLEQDIFPWLGGRPIAEITAPELLAALRRVESRGVIETTHRLRTICGQVFRYAISTGRAERDPAADLRGALQPAKTRHYSTITEPSKIGELLRAIDGYTGTFVVKCAFRLAPLVFVRPGELRQAEWAEIDLDAAVWNIPAEKMKMKEPHLVPLSSQAVTILRELQPLTGSSRYVFPCGRSFARPMSENAVNAALRRMGFEKSEITGHGFRAMARTILDEVLQVRPDFIEHQLAHAVRDPNGRAYNRTAHLPERRRMMQAWADYLDGLKVGCEVVPLRAASMG